MSKLNCIIVEDEPLARQVLEGYILRVPFLQLQGSFEDAFGAMAHLREHDVDVMFLDIHLPELKGISFLKTLTDPPDVIFTTAYQEHALEGFELSAVDYLLKPFEFERFLAAVNKLNKRMMIPSTATPDKDYLFVSVQLKKVKIYFSEIRYVESQKEYVKIVTGENAYLTKMSTHEIELLLPAKQFKRIHRSYIVALDRIRSFNSEMVEIDGTTIPIGRAYRNTLGEL